MAHILFMTSMTMSRCHSSLNPKFAFAPDSPANGNFEFEFVALKPLLLPASRHEIAFQTLCAKFSKQRNVMYGFCKPTTQTSHFE